MNQSKENLNVIKLMTNGAVIQIKAIDWEETTNEAIAWEMDTPNQNLFMLKNAYIDRLVGKNQFYRVSIPFTASTKNQIFNSMDAALKYLEAFCTKYTTQH